ncbi:MAG: MASE4 domain-containing protein [Alphaproteobacteria bacterium]|nr:MASE4 domain-containing protein [Alphaproteobacteria bacterium]
MVTDPEPISRQAFLSTVPALRRERHLALAVVVASAIAFIAVVPFARTPLPNVPSFIPTYESALAINDLITAVLLFGQFARLGSRALLVLACGYLFDALIIIPHALTFPGVFSATGLLGARDQTTAWLYVFWHGGFPLFVLGYAWLDRRNSRPEGVADGIATAMTLGIGGVVLAVIALTFMATRGHDLLPVIVRNGDYSLLVAKGVSPAIWLLSALALVALWRRRDPAVLDLWLMVVMWVWLFDVALSAIVGSARFDLGWYGGRSYGLFASSFVLAVLLLEMNRLYRSLGAALSATEARNLELIRSREELARVQRLEAIGQLTGGIAHDFNNLLTVITGNLDLILRTCGEGSKVERLAQGAVRAAARGEKLTQQLLTFSRRQVTRPETVNPNHLLADFEGFIKRAVGERVEIVTILSPLLDPAHIDTAEFESALLNLVVNARDAIDGAGRITIETKNVVLDAAYAAKHSGVTPGPYVMVAVSDTGSGMSAEVIAKAFDPFFTTKDVGKGSGLGLSQVYGFVKNAGGHVNINSELGVGTTVTLFLPKSANRPVAGRPRSEVTPLRAASGHETILVVEDDEDVIGVVVEGLKDLGYHVLTAMNGLQAVEVLNGPEPIDLLFSDVVMPGGMNGAQLALTAQRIRPHLKVLLTSGYTASALTHEHLLPDNVEVLGKPYRRDELARKLRRAISR